MLVLFVDSKFISPYALSAFVALTEKGVPFELETVDLEAREHKHASYAAESGTARVPMLRHGDFRLSESSAIAEYLEELFPNPPRLYPRDMQDRARARQVQAWLRSDLLPLRVERPTERVFVGLKGEPLSAECEAAVDKLFQFADALVPDDAPYLFGDEWCIADTDLAVMLNRLVRHGDRVPAKLARYASREWERPSVRAWRAHMEVTSVRS